MRSKIRLSPSVRDAPEAATIERGTPRDISAHSDGTTARQQGVQPKHGVASAGVTCVCYSGSSPASGMSFSSPPATCLAQLPIRDILEDTVVSAPCASAETDQQCSSAAVSPEVIHDETFFPEAKEREISVAVTSAPRPLRSPSLEPLASTSLELLPSWTAHSSTTEPSDAPLSSAEMSMPLRLPFCEPVAAPQVPASPGVPANEELSLSGTFRRATNSVPEAPVAPSPSECRVRSPLQRQCRREDKQNPLDEARRGSRRCSGQHASLGRLDRMIGTDVRSSQHTLVSPCGPSSDQLDKRSRTASCTSTAVSPWSSIEQDTDDKRMKTSVSAAACTPTIGAPDTEAASRAFSPSGVDSECFSKSACLGMSAASSELLVPSLRLHEWAAVEESPICDPLEVASSPTASSLRNGQALHAHDTTADEGSTPVSLQGSHERAGHRSGQRSDEHSSSWPSQSAETRAVLGEVDAALAEANDALQDADAAAGALLDESLAAEVCVLFSRREEAPTSHDKEQLSHLNLAGCGIPHEQPFERERESTKSENDRCRPSHKLQLHSWEDSLLQAPHGPTEFSSRTAAQVPSAGNSIPHSPLPQSDLDAAVESPCPAFSSVAMEPCLTETSVSTYCETRIASLPLPESCNDHHPGSQLLGPMRQSHTQPSPMESKAAFSYLPVKYSSIPIPDFCKSGAPEKSCTSHSGREKASPSAAGRTAECEKSRSGRVLTEVPGFLADSGNPAISFLSILEDELFCARALAQLRHNATRAPQESMSGCTAPQANERLRVGHSEQRRSSVNAPFSLACETRNLVQYEIGGTQPMPPTEVEAAPGETGEGLRRQTGGESQKTAEVASGPAPCFQLGGSAHNVPVANDPFLSSPLPVQAPQESFACSSEPHDSVPQLPSISQIPVNPESQSEHLQRMAATFPLSPPSRETLFSLPSLFAPCSRYRWCPNPSENFSVSGSSSPTRATPQGLLPASVTLPSSPPDKPSVLVATSPLAPTASHLQTAPPVGISLRTVPVDQRVPDQRKIDLGAAAAMPRLVPSSNVGPDVAVCCTASSLWHDAASTPADDSSRGHAVSPFPCRESVLTGAPMATKPFAAASATDVRTEAGNAKDRCVHRDACGQEGRSGGSAVTVCAVEEPCTNGNQGGAPGVPAMATFPSQAQKSLTHAQPRAYHPWLSSSPLLCSLGVICTAEGPLNRSPETCGEAHPVERPRNFQSRRGSQNKVDVLCSERARRSMYHPMPSEHVMMKLKPLSFGACYCSGAYPKNRSGGPNAVGQSVGCPTGSSRASQGKSETRLSDRRETLNCFSQCHLERMGPGNPTVVSPSGSLKRPQLLGEGQSTRKPGHSYMFVVRMQARAEERRHRLEQLKLRKASRLRLQEQRQREKQRQQEEAAAGEEARRQQVKLRQRAVTYRKRRLEAATLAALCAAREATLVTVTEAKRTLSRCQTRRTVNCWRLIVVRRRCMDVAIPLARDTLARQWMRNRSDRLKAGAFREWASSTVAERERAKEVMT
ncbi:conserved hypothetical protein [Neospora caninum Liverpool]|nr:conserved hypothetical protein [Neospora caninum Liverpool]CBZ55702.1 conserved hypothetical protein [Neospora caninum Liverpool]|eukprot:XP_003885728.1 conserved hypothetical protein [Neospora caninum Liverpool]